MISGTGGAIATGEGAWKQLRGEINNMKASVGSRAMAKGGGDPVIPKRTQCQSILGGSQQGQVLHVPAPFYSISPPIPLDFPFPFPLCHVLAGFI